MTSRVPYKLLLAASLASIGLIGCTKHQSEEDRLIEEIARERQLLPATAEEKAEIAKQDMITQASFWGDQYELNPTDREAAYEFSRALRAIGSAQRSGEVAAQALALHPNDRELSIVLAKAAMDQGRPDAASTVLFQAISVTDKNDADLYSLFGVSLDQMGEHDQARDQYLKALALEPENAKVMSNLALSYAMEGNAERAEEILRDAIELGDNPDPRVRQNLAMVLGIQGKFDESRELTAEDLPPIMVAANLNYYRTLLTPNRDWGTLRGSQE